MPSFVRYGLFLVAAGVVINLIGWATGTDVTFPMSLVWGVLSIVASIVILVQGVKEHRTATAGTDAEYSFMQAFTEGLKIEGVGYVLALIWNFIFVSYINTDMMSRAAEATRSMMEKMGGDDAALEQALQQFDKTPIEIVFAPSSLITALVIILILCAIVAAVLKRDKKLDV